MADPYVRLSIQGDLPGGEVWSVNPSFIGNFETTLPSHAELQTWADGVADVLLNYDVSSPLLYLLSTSGSITGVRASLYGANGRLADYAESALTSVQTGVGSLDKPPTTAVALSLYSEIPGRQYRGRLFWPALHMGLSPDTGRITGPTTQAIAADASSMLEMIESAAPSTWAATLAVYSTTRGAGVAVSSIRVGNVPDSQRGRKDALVEAYASVAYPS